MYGRCRPWASQVASRLAPCSRVHIRNRGDVEASRWDRDWWHRATAAGTVTSPHREVLALLQCRLGHIAVDIDVLLTRQLHHRVHDLVSNPSKHVAIIACRGVCTEVPRLANSDLRSPHGRDLEEP